MTRKNHTPNPPPAQAQSAPKSQIENPKSQIVNPKSQIVNPKSKIENPKSKTTNLPDFLLTLNSVAQALRYYDANNRMLDRFRESLTHHLEKFRESGDRRLRVQLTADTWFLNDGIIRLGFQEFKKVHQLAQLFNEAAIGEVRFVATAGAEDIIRTLQTLLDAATDPALRERLQQEGLETATFRPPVELGLGGARLSHFELGLRLYAGLVAEGQRLVESIREDTPPDLIRTRRTLRVLTEQADGAQTLLLGLVASPWTTDPLARHAAHVAILAALLAGHLGLPTQARLDLALAGFLHDVFRITLGEALKPPLTDFLQLPAAHRQRMIDLPATIARRMLRWPGATSWLRPAVMTVFENRLDFAARGLYDGSTPPHPYVRFLGVLDRFDSLCLSYPHASAGEILDLLRKQAGKRLDAEYCEALCRLLAPFPPATPVRLSNGRTGIVLTQAPAVLILRRDPDGSWHPDGLLDLTRTDDVTITGALPRKILGPDVRNWFLQCMQPSAAASRSSS